MTPFLKWAGGKRWLVNAEALPVPNSYSRYIEPFLGSGAAFFHLAPPRAILSDLNAGLIHLYSVMRDYPLDLWKLMKRHQRLHSVEYYYKVRASNPASAIAKAAKFLYLNRTCWNGLYRVNLKGQFNVPIGTKQTVVFDNDNFVEISRRLMKAKIYCSDFEPIIDQCRQGDFVFVDPPYTVQHNFNNFVKYNEKIFSWQDQVRLRDAISRAIKRGAAIVMTNADHKCVRDLYGSIGQYTKLDRQSILAGDRTRRGPTTEALFISKS